MFSNPPTSTPPSSSRARAVAAILASFVGAVVVGVLSNLGSDWVKDRVFAGERKAEASPPRQPLPPQKRTERASRPQPQPVQRAPMPVAPPKLPARIVVSHETKPPPLPRLLPPPRTTVSAEVKAREARVAAQENKQRLEAQRLVAWEAKLKAREAQQRLAEARLKQSPPPRPAPRAEPPPPVVQYYSRVTVNGGRPIPRP